MEERRLERWVNIAGLLVCASVALPVLIGQLTGAQASHGPAWAFWVAYGTFVTAMVLVEQRKARLAWLTPMRALAVMALAGWATVLLSFDTGWSAILLVFTAAMAAWVLPVWATVLLIVAQTGVVFTVVTLVGAPPATAALAAVVYAALQVFVAIAGWSDQRAAAVREELATTNVELRTATALLAESSRARERLRIARDLHDLLGHQLTVLALELEVASHHAEPPAAEHVVRARSMAKELLGDVREVVGELRARAPDLGDALREMTLDLERPRIHLDIDDDIGLDDEAVVTLIRCLQELVTNTIRHAGANNLWIDVTRDGRGVTLQVRDDGRGTTSLELGNGLTGLRERIAELGGEVEFDPRSGFEVRARVPTRVDREPVPARDPSRVPT